MDINCPHCGEPWDMDSIHDIELTPEQIKGLGDLPQAEMRERMYSMRRKAFRALGCNAIEGYSTPCGHSVLNPKAADASGALLDILGDDLDGVAAMLDDAEYLGLLD